MEINSRSGMLLGTAHLSERIQPFTIQLKSGQSQPLLRCTSPVGRIELEVDRNRVVECAARNELRIGAIFAGEENRSFNLTVEGCLLLGEDSNPRCSSRRVADFACRQWGGPARTRTLVRLGRTARDISCRSRKGRRTWPMIGSDFSDVKNFH